MTPELRKYYDESFTTMSTEGWKYLIEDLKEMLTQYKDVTSVKDEHTLFYRHGQLDILNWLISRKAVFEDTYEQLVEETKL